MNEWMSTETQQEYSTQIVLTYNAYCVYIVCRRTIIAMWTWSVNWMYCDTVTTVTMGPWGAYIRCRRWNEKFNKMLPLRGSLQQLNSGWLCPSPRHFEMTPWVVWGLVAATGGGVSILLDLDYRWKTTTWHWVMDSNAASTHSGRSGKYALITFNTRSRTLGWLFLTVQSLRGWLVKQAWARSTSQKHRIACKLTVTSISFGW